MCVRCVNNEGMSGGGRGGMSCHREAIVISKQGNGNEGLISTRADSRYPKTNTWHEPHTVLGHGMHLLRVSYQDPDVCEIAKRKLHRGEERERK